jgi:DDE superfamily endonuclease/Tc5 transposase DNA-binding domain
MPTIKSERIAENDATMLLALNDLKKRKFKSVRAAAGHYKVSHTTLLRRWKGGKTIAESREDQQNLTIPEEKALEKWITRMSATGNPVSQDHIREMAQEIQNNRTKRLEEAGGPVQYNPPIGKLWPQRFLHRHPDLATVISRTIESARLKETSHKAIEDWFNTFEETIAEYQISVENMYNMDETGFSIGNIKGAYVVVNKTLQTKLKAHPGRQEWVTVIECVSADGDAISPYIILKGTNMTNAWIPPSVMSLNWHIGCSSRGWTDNDHGYYWLTKIFDPLTREKAGGKSRLLICDGHESHVSGRFAAYCFQHNIILFLLIPHSSHLLQPLDIDVFGPLKKAVSASLEKLIRVGVNRLEKAEWVDKYAEGRVHALTKSNIQGGWRGAGLVPLCR